jgi:hypothetical protein
MSSFGSALSSQHWCSPERSPDRSARLEQLQEQAIGTTITGSAERRSAFDQFQRDARQLLAERTYSRYLALTRRHFKELILKRPAGER